MSGFKIDPSVEFLHREFQQDKLYGELTFKYEAGRVVLMKKSETIKPSSDRDIRGDEESDGVGSGPDYKRRN